MTGQSAAESCLFKKVSGIYLSTLANIYVLMKRARYSEACAMQCNGPAVPQARIVCDFGPNTPMVLEPKPLAKANNILCPLVFPLTHLFQAAGGERWAEAHGRRHGKQFLRCEAVHTSSTPG